MDFEKYFFKLMNYSVFGKTIGNVTEHIDIKLATKNKKRSYLVSEPKYHPKICSSENLLAIEMSKVKIKTNKPAYLGLSILKISITIMYEFGMIISNQTIKATQDYAT